MKSLRFLTRGYVPWEGYKVLPSQTNMTFNSETKELLLSTFSNNPLSINLFRISNYNNANIRMNLVASLSNQQFDFTKDAIICIKCLSEVQACCMVFKSGVILLLHNEPFGDKELPEIVGSVESGIQCMQWSPDEELGVLVTGKETILIITKEFEVLTEFLLNVEDPGEAASISIGWGRKETQFHGSEGKAASQKKLDISDYTISDDDDLLPRISWCGDGSFFTCSTIDPGRGHRVIRIYNRAGVLQSTCEPFDKLEHTLAFRPFGNLIASSQKLHHRHDICFFEKNGLRHGYFTLREKEKHRVIDLLWNCDSSILALLLGRKEYNSQVVHVQLWSISNYHWYLKQEILPVLSKSIISIFWDNEIPLRLHYITEDGYYCHDYVWDTLTANKISKENAATVAVIDGSSLLVTPFRYINIPPPMCAFDIPLDRPAVDVSFSMENHGNDFAVLLATNEISLFDWSSLFQGLPMKPPRLLGTFKPLGQETVVSLRQIIWINRKTVLCLESSPSCEDFIIKITLYFDEDGAPKIDSQIRCSTPGTILRLSTHTHLSEVFIESVEGSIYKVLFDQGIDQVNCIEIEPNPLIRFPECCEYISSTSLGNEGSTNLLFIGLSKGNKLYANDIILAADCTSFFIHNDFLVFTTSNQNVRFISLHLELSEFKPSEAIVEAFDESRRRVERGAKIIIASHFDVSLVLQMPRGNLETIYPRAFVLGAVRQYIDRLEYRSAFMICRKHKLDFNILYDHAPESFLEHIQEFVAQVSEVEYLNLFLSNIRNQDVTHSLYPQLSRLSSHKIREPLNSPGKVNIICDTIRVVLEEVDQRRYIQSILTTYIQKTPPDLEAALNLLIQLKAQDHDFAESALKFTTFLIDPEKLYDVALGLYDFSLVLMVAQQSQRDPREYLPFLTELQSHEKYYQRFKIDDYLKRFEKALKNLSLADDKHLDFCFEYIRKHQLYKAALRIFSKNPEKHKIVVSMYADHLFQDSKFQEAGLAYALAEKPVDALEAFKKACLWRDALVIAQQLKFSKEDLYKLAIELSELLGEKRLFHDAAQVLLDYTE
ncbi:hypothetical protein G9A89_005340, partial [Geosiphon pyriformis]